MCVECGCDAGAVEEGGDEPGIVYVPAEMADTLESGVPVAVDHEGRRIALVHADGRWFAFDDTCTHQGCSLSKGHVRGSSIVCPCHAGTFDMASGEVLEGPPPRPIQTYHVQLRDSGSSERVA